jgi:hypothetical protein
VEYRIGPKLYPLYEDIALQVFESWLIHKPTVTELAKFTLSYFEIWLHPKQAQAIAQQQK